MIEFKTLLKISRPRFWLYLAGPYLLGFTASVISKEDFLTLDFFLPLVFFLIPANIILYGLNDIFDKDTDSINPKKKNKENLLTDFQSKYLKISIALSFVSSLIIIDFSNNLTHLLIFTSFLYLSVFYSVPPLRFKTIPFLDSFSNTLYGLPAVWGFMQNSNDLPSITIWIIIISWNASMHLFSAIPDISVDRKANIKTTAVYLGKNRSLIACTVLWGAFSLTTIYEGYLGLFGYLSLLYPLIPILLLITNKLKLEKVYWYFPYINSFAGFFVFLKIAFERLL